MPGEIIGKIVNSKGEYVIRMYTLREFVLSLEKYPSNTYMQLMYLSALCVGVDIEEFLNWDMPDAAPVINRVAEALKKLTI